MSAQGLLRSVIDFEETLSQENMIANFQKLAATNLEWARPEDKKVFDFLKSYFQLRLEMPSKATLIDYFEEAQDVETQERIKDIEKSPPYIRSNFAHLLSSTLEEQYRLQTVQLFKQAQEIATKGLMVDGEKKFGVQDSIIHVTSSLHKLSNPTHNTRLRGELREDAAEVWDEYQAAKANKGLAYGRFTGLNNIDKVCHGAKKGEMWVHAAFSGELKCENRATRIFDHKTRKMRTVGEIFDSGDLPIVTALHREGETFRLVEAQVSHVVENGIRDIYRLRLKTGRYVDATTNHLIFTATGWKELGEIQPGEFVAVPRQFVVSNPRKDFSDAQVKFIGYMLGDGHFGGSGSVIDFAAGIPEVRLDFESTLKELGYRQGTALEVPQLWYHNRPDDKGLVCSAHTSAPGRVLAERLGLWKSRSSNKFIPAEFFGLPESQVALLLGALWSTDGSCHAKDHSRTDRASKSKRNDITYASICERLCLDIQSILLRLGIQSSVTRVDTTYKGEPYVFYTLRVTGNDSKRKFCQKVRVVGKEASFAALAARLPEDSGRLIPTLFLPGGRKFRQPAGYIRPSNTVKGWKTASVEEIRKFLEPGDHELIEALEGDLDWDAVESVTYESTEMTYDLSVPEHHSFVANDIVTHNTTFATNWCYNLVTRYRSNVLYISLEMTYEHIRRLIYVIHSANARFKLQGFKPLDYRKVRDGDLSDEEEIFYRLVVDDFNSNEEYGRFEVWRPADLEVTVDDIQREAEITHRQTEVGLLVIDHGGLVDPRKRKRSKDPLQEANSVIRDAKRLALNFNGGEAIPTLLLFQINRQGKDEADKNEGQYKNLKALAYANECLVGNTLVRTNHGLVPIQSVTPGDQVWSSTGWKNVLHRFDQGPREVFRLETSGGWTLTATANHRVRTLDEMGNLQWSRFDQLTSESWVLSCRVLDEVLESNEQEMWPIGDLYRTIYRRYRCFPRDGALIDGRVVVPIGPIKELIRTLDGVDDPEVHQLANLIKTYKVQRVKEVVPAGVEEVFDLEVNGDHEFMSGMLLSHNCERSADIVTATYLNTEHRKNGTTVFSNLKNRDNPLFDPFIASVDFSCRRMTNQDPFAGSSNRGMSMDDQRTVIDGMFGV